MGFLVFVFLFYVIHQIDVIRALLLVPQFSQADEVTREGVMLVKK